MLLRRTDVVDGAIRLLDAEGLGALTTRKLGATLGIQGPALYRHFPSKEALLDAIADRLVEGISEDLPHDSWDKQLAAVAGRFRRALLSHRDGARVVAGTYVTGPNTRLLESTILDIFETAGLPAQRAGQVAFALSHYVLGHTIEEQAQADLVAAGAWDARLEAMADEADSSYAQTAIKATFETDPTDRFDYGLGLLLDGIRHQLRHPPAGAALHPEPGPGAAGNPGTRCEAGGHTGRQPGRRPRT